MFVSYAQNCEDALLWRALSGVEEGFYIDIGASDPDHHSVTRAFYERGWSGINVEPLPLHSNRLREVRPRDVTIQAMVGSQRSRTRFYEVTNGDGLSTSSEEIASGYRTAGVDLSEIEVDCIPLSAIFERCAGREVHFLKIDVEGAERDVLASGDFSTNRPWVVVVEAVRPFNSLIDQHLPKSYFDRARRCDSDWNHFLLDNGYEFRLFDGVNSYFVAEEHATSVGPRLAIPVNVLDDVVPAELAKLRDERLVLMAEIGELSRYAEVVDKGIKTIAEGLYSTAEFFGRAEAARIAMRGILGTPGAHSKAVEGDGIDR